MSNKTKIHIRPATIADVPGISFVHQGETDPWADMVEAAIWVNHRLLRGFRIDVALVNQQVIGHAEWIQSNDPSGKHYYLGMLQVNPDFRRLGVGRALVETGIARAKELRCRQVRTIPDPEAMAFYDRCCFKACFNIVQYNIPCAKELWPVGWLRTHTVPYSIIRNLPFRLGWAGQACPAHMWEVCNRPVLVAGDIQRTLTAKQKGGQAYVQLRYTGGETALAVAWAPNSVPLCELIPVALALATELPMQSVCISLPESHHVQQPQPSQVTPLPSLQVWTHAPILCGAITQSDASLIRST